MTTVRTDRTISVSALATRAPVREMMLRRAVATAIALAATAPAAAPAAPATRPGLPGLCRDWGGDRVVALACDPASKARAIDLRLGGRRAAPTHTLGVGRVAGAEPLQAGETVTLRWRHPSSRAVLAVWATGPRGTRMVVLDLRARPASVNVAAQPGGALRVTTPAGSGTVGAAPLPAPVVWQPRSARAAATAVLVAVDRLERERGIRTLCAALDPDVFPALNLLFGDPAKYPCPSGLAFRVYGDENVPTPTSTTHRGSSLAVDGGRALLSTTLVHRYRPYSTGDPERLVVRARVLLVRDPRGIWRLGTIAPLLPLVAVTHRRAFTDAELARRYRADVRDGRAAAALYAGLQAQRDAATVDASAPAPCSVAPRGDPAGDVVVQESSYRARDQTANAGLDLVGAGAAGGCIALRTAGPLPASFQVDLRDGGDRSLRATVTAGRVLVEDTTNDDDLPKPVAGIAAHLDPDGLIVSLPQPLKAPVTLMLGVERNDLTYSDDATTARATSRRCARPTC
jgi:hypothetical protein